MKRERERELELENFILQGSEREHLSVKSDASLGGEAHEYSLFHFLKCKEPAGLMHTKVHIYLIREFYIWSVRYYFIQVSLGLLGVSTRCMLIEIETVLGGLLCVCVCVCVCVCLCVCVCNYLDLLRYYLKLIFVFVLVYKVEQL